MNVDRLIQTLNHIIQHPETWNQMVWHCGTVHCFAGHGQINSGEDINDATCLEDAIEWYELNRKDAEWLFDSYRTLPEIHAFVKAAKDGVVFFDEDGYDHEGYDRFGYDRDGFNSEWYNRDGFDRAGFNRDGFDRYGNKLPLL